MPVEDGFSTKSEWIFNQLCIELGYNTRQLPRKPPEKTPDFEVECGDTTVFVEVKEFANSDTTTGIGEVVGRGDVYVEPVDFTFSGGLYRKLAAAEEQLKCESIKGAPTIIALYSHRFFGAADYQIENMLQNNLVEIPSTISAVMWMTNTSLETLSPRFILYKNGQADNLLPETCFPVQ
jgi:hypothetical protein